MFISYSFILFIALLLVVYYIVPKRLQWIILLIANFVFYCSAGSLYWVFILLTSFTVYIAGIIMGRLDDRLSDYNAKIRSGEIQKPSREEKKLYKKKVNGRKKAVMLLCLFINLGILAVLKYTNFTIDNINALFHMTGRKTLSYVDFIIPMGISFYTFQAVGYLIDVYWNKCTPQKNFFKFTLFVSFFPQLIQGPISRYGDLSQTLYKEHVFDWKNIRFGLERVLWGYFKKLVIADRLSGAIAMLMGDPDYYTGAYVFIGMLFYAAQLYADFTGGIDITIGIAQTLGIHVEENFIRPFFSKNIAEYWRRWHITMGTWFRDYIFYPCSLSRPLKALTTFAKKHFGMGAARRVSIYISTMLVWLATGIWHGAEWHFVAWGLTNGVIILISEELKPLYEKFHKKFPKLVASYGYRMFQVIRTFLLMCCIRIFDTYGSARMSLRQFIHMFTRFDISKVTKSELLDLGLTGQEYIVIFTGVAAMTLVSLLGRKRSVREQIAEKPYILRFSIFLILFLAVILFGSYGVGFDAKQFIYNQF